MDRILESCIEWYVEWSLLGEPMIYKTYQWDREKETFYGKPRFINTGM